ncbi:MAG TPA: alpha-2-macroglobulin [Rhodanobacteraceae bacterium]
MDLLKWLLRLPVRVLRGVWRVLAWLLRPLFGQFHWTAPDWMRAVGRRPRTSAGMAVIVIVLIVAGYWGWHWYTHRPVPPHLTFQVTAPAVTDYARKNNLPPIVHPLEVTFSGSAAPIEKVNEVIRKGISTSPSVKGTWKWVDDHTLRFTPAADWPVGQHYRVHFDVAQLLAPQVRVGKNHFAFATEAFQATLAQGEFHQDPKDARNKQVIQEIDFNYPVDAASLEKRVHLAVLDEQGKPARKVAFTITYGKHKLKAWVHSASLPLPHDAGQLQVTVDAGVTSLRGGAGTDAALDTSVAIPGLYSLAVDDLAPTVAEDQNQQPQQVLVARFSAAVRATDVASHVHAWVLPKHRVGQHGSYTYPWDVSDVGTKVIARSQPLPLAVTPTELDWQPLQSFHFHAKPGQRIYVRIDKGVKSFGGYVMGKPLARVFTVPAYPQTLAFVGSGSLLSLSGSRRIAVVSRNMPGFKLAIGRVLPGQLQHLASLNQGTYGHPQLPYAFSEDQIVDRHVIRRALPAGDPAKAAYTGIDLGQYLAAGQRGVFWLHLSGYDPAKAARARQRRARDCAARKAQLARPATSAKSAAATVSGAGISACDNRGEDGGKMYGAPTDSRLIVVTDLGLLVKTAVDGSQDVFVQSIHTGHPVAGATVSVVAVDGKSLLSRTTGADGMVHFPSLDGFDHANQPAMYLVTKGGDASFLPVGASDRLLDYSRFSVGGATNAVNPGQLTAYLFSDRGLYRPGETMHVGTIVRPADWSLDVAGIPLQAELVDPRGNVVQKFPLTLDRTGFNALSWTFPQTAATGTWTVNLYIMHNGHDVSRIGSTTVAVKQFMPQRMKVAASLSAHVADGWVSPDKLLGEVDAANLFGTPASDRRVSASITLQPADPEFAGWTGWHFHDLHQAKQGYQQDLPDARTDAKGHASFKLDLSRYADATYRLTFLARVYAAGGGRNVAALASAMVSDNAWLVGYKSEDDLHYVPRGAVRKVRLVAINPEAKSIALDHLIAERVERKYVSVLTRQPSGAYKYESRKKDIPLSSHPMVIPVGGKVVTLATGKPGNFALVIRRASDHKVVNRIDYSVAGAGNVSRSLERNAELQLTLDKQVYKPGQTIHVSIRAPYTGSGLITIERDKVYAHTWFHTDTTSSVQSITIPKNFQGNGYVNVQFVRDPSSDAIFMSPLSYGVAPFRISRAGHRDALQVTVPGLVKPGHDAVFHLVTAHPAKVVVFAINEGILKVARYHFEDPLDTFFAKRMLGVSTSQILNLILPEFEKLISAASTPGGDANAAISRQLNPFHRKEKAPVAYWSGIVPVTSAKDFTYHVPGDFNGQLRVMAVAVTPGRIGIWQGKTIVRGDFVLSPNAPTTLAPGDVARISVGVANNLTDIGKAKVPVKVTLVTDAGLKVLDSATQTVDLASMREGKVLFRVKAMDKLGSADLHFTAQYGSHTVQLATTISVRPDVVYRVSIDTHRVAPGGQFDVTGLRRMYTPYARRDAVLSSSPQVLARGLVSYLIDYPYQCTEQLVSGAMPRLIVPHWPAAQAFIPAFRPTFGGKRISNAQALTHFLATLQTRQNSAGGFGLWSATPTSLPFISDYAMNFLLEARRRGVAVSPDMLSAGNGYLKQLASDDSLTSLSGLRDRAYAIYLLTEQGNITTNAIAAVQQRLQKRYPKRWKDDLAAAWLAASYKMLKQDREADKLIAGPLSVLERDKPDEDDFDFVDYYGPAVRDASVLYVLARHFPERVRNLPPQVLENIAWPLVHHHYNTLSASMTLLALDAYASVNAGGLDKMNILALQTGGKAVSIGKVAGNLLDAHGWSAAATGLRFVNGSQQPAWSVVTQSGYDRKAPGKAIKQGLEVVRRYTDMQGKPIDKVTLGEEIEVHVLIRAIGKQDVDHVAIVDLLPGGFDPVLRTPSAQANSGSGSGGWTSPIGLPSSTWQPNFAEVREDRVLIYGPATPDVQEFTYKIRATNVGTFRIPPIYASDMYRPQVQAQAPGGGTLTVVAPKP